MPLGGGTASDGSEGSISFGGSAVGSFSWRSSSVRKVFICVFTLLSWICILGAIIGGALSSRQNETAIATNFYSPGDSRLLLLSSFFCDGASLELSSNSVLAMLFMVDLIPPLNDSNNFAIIVDSSFDPLEFRFWQYHLHPNSNISLSLQTNFLINVYIIKGNDNANRWRNSLNGDFALETLERETSITDVSYQVDTEDEYYIVIYNSLASRSVHVSASLTFERSKYSVPPSAIMETDRNCVVNKEGHCHLDIPYKIGSQRFLVTTSIPAMVDFGENIQISLHCDQREWTYAVVILVPVSIVIAIFAFCVLIILYRRRRCNKG